MIIIFPYLSLLISKSSPIPVPKAVIIAFISSEFRILSILAFSTFNIFPLKGRIAWVLLSLPFLAEPPAESPSTINTSFTEVSVSWQSASLPGRVVLSKIDLFLVKSLAFLEASLALWALIALSIITLATLGFSSKYAAHSSEKKLSTIPLISLLPNLALVCPSNWGFANLTDTIAVIPSLASSPDKFSSFSLIILYFLPYSLIVLVKAALKPVIWVPPSGVKIVFANE